MLIRAAASEDWPAIWTILRPIIAAGETFAYDPAMDEPQARGVWLPEDAGRTVVAIADDGTVVGTAKMGPNHGGAGAHIATASFMVAADHAGQGIGRALVGDALSWARDQGYRGMQFNAVAASNDGAVGLYRSLGFEIVGTIPGGFRHPVEGYVGLHVMYRPV